MKSWQPQITNLTDWIRQHPLAIRWGAATVIVVTLTAWLAGQFLVGTTDVSLFESRQLTTDEIGLMQVAFGKSGLNEYDIEGNQVVVSRTLRAEYLKSLSEHGAIPRDLTSHLESASSFDFFQTRAQQRVHQIDRKKQTIRKMVMQLRFVERAIVDYDEARGATPFEDMQRTAIVNVTPASNQVLTHSEVKAIRDTVCGAVAGLQARDITVIDTYASKSHTGDIAAEEQENLPPHTLTKLQAERKYEEKIRSALSAYPGIRVNVEVGIDPIVRRIRDERNLDREPRVYESVRQTVASDNVPSTSPSFLNSLFVLGANTQAGVASLETPGVRSTESVRMMANGTFQTTETAGPVVTRVNVSIGIPERCVQFFVQQQTSGHPSDPGENQRHRNKVFEQLQNDIRQKVNPLVPLFSRQEDSQRIVVTLDREIRVDNESDPADSATTLIAWQWVLLVGSGMFVLALFLPIGKRRKHDDNPITEDSDAIAMTSSARSPTSSTSRPMTRESNRTQSELEPQQQMRSQLDHWCRENPEAAAATIRQWLKRKAG